MNFEFKSTFKNIKTRAAHVTPGTWPVCILLINVTSLLLVVWLYLENSIIPAMYGSGASAAMWIVAVKVAALLWMVSTLLAVLRLISIRVYRKPVFMRSRSTVTGLLANVKETARMQLIQFLLVMHLLKELDRRAHHRFISEPVRSSDSSIIKTYF